MITYPNVQISLLNCSQINISQYKYFTLCKLTETIKILKTETRKFAQKSHILWALLSGMIITGL